MNILFAMDPLETVLFEKDTTLALMYGAQRRGHRIFYLPDDGISLSGSGIRLRAQEIRATDNKGAIFIHKGIANFTENDIDVIFIRNDPPFDADYLMRTWMLDRVARHTAVINAPSGIRTINEKLWTMQFPDIIPDSLASQNRDALYRFVEKHGTVIAKPTDSFGGQGVFKLNRTDTNCHVTLETLSRNFTRKIILQKYVPDAQRGDKRILLLDGKPLGAILRIHPNGEHRNNIAAGGTAHPDTLTERDHYIIRTIAPELHRHEIFFAGIDILGGFLIEVNVTSPTCLQEMNRFYDKHLEDDVIQFAELLCQKRRTT